MKYFISLTEIFTEKSTSTLHAIYKDRNLTNSNVNLRLKIEATPYGGKSTNYKFRKQCGKKDLSYAGP